MPITAWVSVLAIPCGSDPPDPLPQTLGCSFQPRRYDRITSRFAARLPGFGILTHVGRKSGKVYPRAVSTITKSSRTGLRNRSLSRIHSSRTCHWQKPSP
jgi:hypothetical protein